MADLFTRLASRAHTAGREYTGVVPRLPARFEHTSHGDDGLAVHDVETSAPAAPVRPQIGVPARGPAELRPSPDQRESAPATVPPVGTESVVRARSTVERVVHRTDTPHPEAVRRAPIPAGTAAERAAVREIGTSAIRPVTVVHHSEVRPRAATADRPRSDVPVEKQPDLPAVHISIGRIEVRATTTPLPTPVAAPQPAPEAGRSLAAYLRGDDGGPR
jgi:hypothetical protein